MLRSSENLDAKVDYVLRNPVRKGLVAQWQDYRWTWQRRERPTAEMKLVGPLVV
ncbi:MAG TPA: hypothetical protein VNX87_21195 [Candidatus Sulfotelmatobacter sp.]|nr:hypothetical protein [Candidatus Sulfotelmatobacter sp.]